MGRTYLLTGRPGVGKTTCLLAALAALGMPAGGFVTEEIRERGARVGFALRTLDGRRATLAHVDRRGPPRVGKYGVSLEALERLGVPALRDALTGGRLVVVDEIGKMEMASRAFRDAVEEVLRGPGAVLGTILAAADPWADRVKAAPGVRVIEVTRANRDALPAALARLVTGTAGP
ncbi:MAG: NTPase [Candidatus Rokuibacteriota bacterium]